MPLPAIRKGTTKRCTARTKSRNLDPCYCPAAFGTNVCNKHGAVRPKDRATGKAHGNYKKGNYTKDKLKENKEQATVLRNLEDVLFVLGAIEGKQHTRGRKPDDYKNIQTLDQAQNYILELEEKNTSL
jgi:hypothetical protein